MWRTIIIELISEIEHKKLENDVLIGFWMLKSIEVKMMFKLRTHFSKLKRG